MIVVTSALRTSRRPRRTSSLASIVRVIGSVRISDSPPGFWAEGRDGFVRAT